jgi:hypothetical protein
MGTVPFNTTFYPTSQYNMWTLLTTPVSPNTLRDDGNGVGKLVVTVWLINDLKNHVVWFDDMTLTCT